MRVAFYTFGCKVNQYETQVLSRWFGDRGHQVVAFGEDADAVVINSCTVTAEGDRKTRQLLRRVRRQQPQAALALSGCYPQAFPREAAALDVDVVTGSKDREGLLDALEEHMASGHKVVNVAAHSRGETFEVMQTEAFGGRTRAFVKIQDGCERYCAYCIIPTARGPVRSKDLGELHREVEALVAAGYREVVLAGINLSCYGQDLGLRLIDAVRTVAGVEGLGRIRLGSLESDIITPEDIAEMAALGKVCPQFHLSLQSGCDATLRRMGRRYLTDEYRRMAETFRRYFPQAALTTDLMVGFPGETDQEFNESMAFARETGFAKIHVFSYSPRPGTRAAEMPDQVPAEIKKARSAAMLALGQELRREFLQSMVGTVQPVLLEERGESGLTGYAPNYTPVTVADPEVKAGAIVNVLLTGIDQDGCEGQLADLAAHL